MRSRNSISKRQCFAGSWQLVAQAEDSKLIADSCAVSPMRNNPNLPAIL
jgi:hypothetical protein